MIRGTRQKLTSLLGLQHVKFIPMSDPGEQSHFSLPFICNITHKLYNTFEWYTMENPMSDSYFLTILASLWASEYTEYNGQQNPEQDVKVEYNTIESRTAVLRSD